MMPIYSVSRRGETISVTIDGHEPKTFARIKEPNFRRARNYATPKILQNSNLKIERARKQISEFYLAMEDFYTTNPIELIDEFDASNRNTIHYANLKNNPPKQLSLILGDIIHNLRCALDYMVCDLARGAGNTPHQNGGLPLKDYKSNFNPDQTKKLKGVPAKSISLITRILNHRYISNILYDLNRLDAINKHNFISTCAAATTSVSVSIQSPLLFTGPSGEPRLLGPGPDGSPLVFGVGSPNTYSRKILHPGKNKLYESDPNIETNVNFIFDIVFGQDEHCSGKLIFEFIEEAFILVDIIVTVLDKRY